MSIKTKSVSLITELHESLPDLELITNFFMQAEELAKGKHQKEVVFEVVEQFASLVLHAETLQTKMTNVKESHKKLVTFIQALKQKCNTPEGISAEG